MLIEFLFEKFPNGEDVNETAIGDLQVRDKFQYFVIWKRIDIVHMFKLEYRKVKYVSLLLEF